MTGLAVADRVHQLDLVFGRTGGTGPTRLVSRRVAYPFSVADVFRLDRLSRDPASRDRATVILQSASGGLFEDEDLSLSIAAASILAKTARDRLMIELDGRYPGYGFASHKGYNAPAHQAALKVLGPCPAHRRGWSPIKALLEEA